MTNHDIRIGDWYVVTVFGRDRVVRIDSDGPDGGWNAVDAAMGQDVRISTDGFLCIPVEIRAHVTRQEQ